MTPEVAYWAILSQALTFGSAQLLRLRAGAGEPATVDDEVFLADRDSAEVAFENLKSARSGWSP
jgi:hypothetical protein